MNYNFQWSRRVKQTIKKTTSILVVYELGLAFFLRSTSHQIELGAQIIGMHGQKVGRVVERWMISKTSFKFFIITESEFNPFFHIPSYSKQISELGS